MSTPPSQAAASSTKRHDRVAVGHVDDPGAHAVARAGPVLLEPGRVHVGRRDARALGQEPLRGREPDAARGAGHDRALALDATGHVRHSANAMPQPVIASVR